MALSTSRVSANASPGMAAAATARPVSGGRNVASVNSKPVDELGFSQHIGVNDNGLWRYDEETQFESDGEGQPQQRGTPFIIRAATGFKVDLADEATDPGGGGRLLSEVMRGVGVYEFNMRVTTPGAVKPGSVFNYRS
jgi:hypothetical protein